MAREPSYCGLQCGNTDPSPNAADSLGYLRLTAKPNRTISAMILSSELGWRTSMVGELATGRGEAVGIVK